ncbi:MAG: 23S rRNA (adenine(2503)-C(2))-methyltransferase RlmN [Spirochaetales bacterium]|nr:23S rRNA (adenine(2503)-C(2))-methyltransferase RlmN [Spirochaetales bacterium]
MATLYCLTNDEIKEYLGLEKDFQAKIVYSFLTKGVTDFSLMTSLPKVIRERIIKDHPSALSSKVIRRSTSDSALKLAIELEDGAIIECVRLSDGNGRYTACLSSQVGCAMGCAFCKTGTMGLVRNVKAGEIVEELIHLEKEGEHITHIVFMGMGEPLANFTEVMKAITYIHREDGINISYRRITISTCGLVPGIKRLAELHLPVRLAVSLVAADDDVRSSVMPVNTRFPLSELKKALISFQHRNEKRITLEYCMLGGINTTEKAAKSLQKFTKGLEVLVNLIPWNPIDNLPFSSPSDSEVRKFTSILKSLGVNYSIRREKGRSADAACGQLASETMKSNLIKQ